MYSSAIRPEVKTAGMLRCHLTPPSDLHIQSQITWIHLDESSHNYINKENDIKVVR